MNDEQTNLNSSLLVDVDTNTAWARTAVGGVVKTPLQDFCPELKQNGFDAVTFEGMARDFKSAMREAGFAV